jgi:capsular polysaccharide biosynthesis protein
MQLRTYMAILRRLWPVVLLLPLAVGALSLVLALRHAPAYQATARLLVTQAPPPARSGAPLPALGDEASWAASDYILDDLPAVLASAAFAADVAALLAADGYALTPAAIQTSLSPAVHHRAVTLSATAATPEEAQALVRAAIAALEQGGLRYWGRAPAGGLHVAVLDPPGLAVLLGGPRAVMREVGLRTALALVAGVGLAFLVHYFDDRLRSSRQAEEWTGARVLAVIPKE